MSRHRRRFFDPEGKRYGLPTWPWQMAPAHLATRRQLSAAGLRPGGSAPAGQVMWMRHRKPAVAFLYDLGAAVPKREYGPGLARSVAAMLAARSTCRNCGTAYDFCLPKTRDCAVCQNQPAPEGSDL
jgi:hypothetical protein